MLYSVAKSSGTTGKSIVVTLAVQEQFNVVCLVWLDNFNQPESVLQYPNSQVGQMSWGQQFLFRHVWISESRYGQD